MNNYRIDFKLVNGRVSFIDTPNFDSILAFCYVKNELKERFAQKVNYTEDELVKLDKMPIKLNTDGFKPYFEASYLFGSEQIEDTASYKRRFPEQKMDLIDFGKSKKDVDTSRGKFKNYNNTIVTHFYDDKTVSFVFRSDNVDLVKELLENHLIYIGKKGSQGFGVIESFEINEISEQEFKNFYHRPIPADPKNKVGEVAYKGYYPPYHLSINQTFCYDV